MGYTRKFSSRKMIGALIISFTILLLISSCISLQKDVNPTIVPSATTDFTLEIIATITPSITSTTTSPHSLPTKTISPDITTSEPITKMETPQLVSLDCSPAFHLKQLGGSKIPQAPIDLDVVGNIAYVLENEGFWVMDVSSFTNPLDVRFIPMTQSKQLIIDDGYAYGIDTQGLWVFDLSNPLAPEFVGFKDIPYVPMDTLIKDGIAYLRDNNGVLHIFNLEKPDAITEIGVYDPPGKILSGEIYGNTIARLIGIANTNPIPSFSILDEYIYVADLDGGLRVIDISDPSGPIEIGSNTFQVSDIQVIGDRALIYEIGEGEYDNQWILGISTQSTFDAPIRLGVIPFWWNITSIGNMTSSALCTFISEIYGLLLDSEVGVKEMNEIRPIDLITQLKGVDVLGEVIFIADEEKGLQIFQIISVDD